MKNEQQKLRMKLALALMELTILKLRLARLAEAN